MDEIIQYLGAMTLGTLSLPMALGLGWLSLRLVFDWMPAANRAPRRIHVAVPARAVMVEPAATPAQH